MKDLDALLNRAVEAGDVPFVVAMVANRDHISWSGGAGEAAPGLPADEKTVFRIYSMTKAIGATAAMILIDRGQLDAETPVADILPDFAELGVLEGFDSDAPRLRSPKVKATIRHLATHTSGLAYPTWHAGLARYFETTRQPTMSSGQRAGLFHPLVDEPGTAWHYGIGIDWLGQVVEAVDGRRIDRFCHEEIFEPLGMVDTDFEVRPDLAPRLARARRRQENGALIDIDMAPPARPEIYGMGHALYSTAYDFMRFLRMFLDRGELDGRRILREAAFEAMVTNQIGPLRVTRMTSVFPGTSADVELFPGFEKSHSFGFVRLEEDVPGMRSAGSLGWAGVLNTHFWFDPAREVAGLLMTQMLPFVEPNFMDLYARFERAVYAELGLY